MPGPAQSAAGKLTLNSDLTLSSDSRIVMQLLSPDNFASPDNDLTTVQGKLLLDGTLDFDATNGFGGVGDYLLFTYGILTDNGLQIGTHPPNFNGADFSIDLTHPGQVILHVVPEPASLALLLLFTLLLPRRRIEVVF
jgi:fibronectin-binding autotransporter adhesin